MLNVRFGNFFVLSKKSEATFAFQQRTKQLLQSSFCYNNCTHVTFLKNRAYVKNPKWDNEEMHTLPQNMFLSDCSICLL